MARDISRVISGLMKKAESTESEHEREALFQKAQSLSTMHGIDMAVAMSERRKREGQSALKPEKRYYEAGVKGDRGAGAYSELFTVIGYVNDVKVYSSNSEIDAYGMPHDLDTAEQLYYTILPQMVKSCVDYLDSGDWKVPGNRGRADARRSFYAAYRGRIQTRLMEARRESEAEAAKKYEGRAAVAIRDKKEKVHQLFRADVGKVRYRTVDNGSNRAAKGAGTTAASRANIGGSDVSISGSGRALR